MEQRNVKPVRLQVATLGQILLIEENSTVALTQKLSTLSIKRLESERRERQELEVEIESLRRSYLFAKRKNTGKENTIIEKAEKLKSALCLIPEQKSLRDIQLANERYVNDEIMLLLCWVNDAVNVEGLSPQQMEMAAIDIVGKYGSLRLEDVGVCFRNAVRGDYGAIWGKVDVADILRWMGLYAVDLNRQRFELSEGIHVSNRGSFLDDRSSDEVSAEYRKFRIDYLVYKNKKNGKSKR